MKHGLDPQIPFISGGLVVACGAEKLVRIAHVRVGTPRGDTHLVHPRLAAAAHGDAICHTNVAGLRILGECIHAEIKNTTNHCCKKRYLSHARYPLQ
jgi:hypothetical protein